MYMCKSLLTRKVFNNLPLKIGSLPTLWTKKSLITLHREFNTEKIEGARHKKKLVSQQLAHHLWAQAGAEFRGDLVTASQVSRVELDE